MDRKRLDVNDYQNASDEFKKDVAFANTVLDKVYAKINEQSQTMLDDAVEAKPTGGFVHSTENIAKPKSKLLLRAKAKVLRSLRLSKNKIIVIKNKSN
ncbi:hypothetical protein ACI2I3_00735 [Psychrobacter namhaensis]|uniref:Uncharacterized protein n=1 Tax=Psychrobacter namhaensis TaxID=292734 RepID=A0ABW8L4Q3_9GAMM